MQTRSGKPGSAADASCLLQAANSLDPQELGTLLQSVNSIQCIDTAVTLSPRWKALFETNVDSITYSHEDSQRGTDSPKVIVERQPRPSRKRSIDSLGSGSEDGSAMKHSRSASIIISATFIPVDATQPTTIEAPTPPQGTAPATTTNTQIHHQVVAPVVATAPVGADLPYVEAMETDAVATITVIPKEEPWSGVKRQHLPTKSNKAVATGQGGTFTSIYRGVTKHRLTGRYEAHYWDAQFKREKLGKGGRTRGRQVYLGGYQTELEAAKSYDLAALAFLGRNAPINFPVESYEAELEGMRGKAPEEVVCELRRCSVGFARGQSQYRGVTKHHLGKWEARLGKVAGIKYLYLGTYDSPEEAARAYDKAAVKYRGKRATTNFPLSNYANILANPDSYDIQANIAAAAAGAATLTNMSPDKPGLSAFQGYGLQGITKPAPVKPTSSIAHEGHPTFGSPGAVFSLGPIASPQGAQYFQMPGPMGPMTLPLQLDNGGNYIFLPPQALSPFWQWRTVTGPALAPPQHLGISPIVDPQGQQAGSEPSTVVLDQTLGVDAAKEVSCSQGQLHQSDGSPSRGEGEHQPGTDDDTREPEDHQTNSLSPLAASLLSPLGLHGPPSSWKDSPLGRMLSGEDMGKMAGFQTPASIKHDPHQHTQGPSRRTTTQIAAPCRPQLSHVPVPVPGGDDLWGAVNWLECLDINQLNALPLLASGMIQAAAAKGDGEVGGEQQ